jgi:putative endonuclease
VTKTKHYIYILKCRDGSFYTGYAVNVSRRVEEHNGQGKAGARYTRARRPVELVYTEIYKTRSDAQKREAQIKKLSRKEKEILIHRKGKHPLTKIKNEHYNLSNMSAQGPRRQKL